MEFFKKIGRPTDEEQMIIDAIGNIIKQRGLSASDIPECYNLDDLMTAVELLEAIEVQSTAADSMNQIDEVEQEEESGQDDIPEIETDESYDQNESGRENQEIPAMTENDLPNFEDSDYDPFADPIIERSYTGVKANTNEEQKEEENDELDLNDSGNTPLSDLNPKAKLRAAEKTAEAILKGYKNLAPEPFKWWCKFPEDKIERMTFEGEINPDIEVEQGVTFDEYIKQTNEQIDEIFEVQEETLEEIKEPLVEVLLEQELELTPQQRLGMAVLSHLIQMFTMAMKLWGQNKRILEYQKHLTHLAHQARAQAA
ncbi:hypothetical protein [Parvicella tangerina]|uniref:Uncharacterized protein n=1 Tax=Parvicella tangerina TaxID=2829795 RepID=A0A916NEJ4_9FLAO|nr:hypothetical protein [Parvicella tangerina]CAG5086820.1 hypothetical protein CRYO30217_03294 [Parvicella tangerina]